MYCVNCGNSLREGVKFCGSCGTKVESSKTSLESKLVQLAELPGDLQRCKVSIHEVNAEELGDDGDISLRIQYVVDNHSDEDWEHIATRIILLNGNGGVIDETYDTIEQTIPAGDEIEMEGWISGINAALFSGTTDTGQVVVQVVASRLLREKLGNFAIPSEPYDLVPIKPCSIGDKIKVISGSLWRSSPDSDKDCRVVIKVLCQNLTETWLPVVKVEAKLTDKLERDIDTLDQSEEIRPGAITTIDCSTYLKQNKLAGGVTAVVAVNAFTSFAIGVNQKEFSVDRLDTSELAIATKTSHIATIEDEGENKFREFYANMEWFDVAEQPSDFNELPSHFKDAYNIWLKEGKNGVGKIIEILRPYVTATFIPSGISNWEELFTPDEDGEPPEVEAKQINVVGIDFSSKPIPRCRAEAWFDVKVKKDFDEIDLQEWQENNEHFFWGVSFRWEIQRTDNTEDLDFTWGDNMGVECMAAQN